MYDTKKVNLHSFTCPFPRRLIPARVQMVIQILYREQLLSLVHGAIVKESKARKMLPKTSPERFLHQVLGAGEGLEVWLWEQDHQRCGVWKFCSVWLSWVCEIMGDSSGTHWDALGFFWTFHGKPVFNNFCQVRFILHVEHERSCIDSMVQNWAMMQRRLPCQLSSVVRFPVPSCTP